MPLLVLPPRLIVLVYLCTSSEAQFKYLEPPPGSRQSLVTDKKRPASASSAMMLRPSAVRKSGAVVCAYSALCNESDHLASARRDGFPNFMGLAKLSSNMEMRKHAPMRTARQSWDYANRREHVKVKYKLWSVFCAGHMFAFLSSRVPLFLLASQALGGRSKVSDQSSTHGPSSKSELLRL